MADFILGIDAGGTAVKAAIYSLDGRELGLTVRNCRPLTPAPGHVERDPLQLARLFKRANEVAKVSVGHGNEYGNRPA